ncbi:MAG TPA: AraC family transcriptional regulator [Rhizomicrobium sp.]
MLQAATGLGVPRFRTEDAGACREYIRATTGTHRFEIARKSSLLDFVHRECSIGRVALHSIDLSTTDGFRITKADAAPYYSFQFLLDGECRLDGAFGSVRAGPGDVFVLDPDHLTREFWPGRCLQFLMRIDRDVIEQAAAAELGKSLTRRLVFEPIMRDPGISAWLDCIVTAVRTDGAGAAVLGDRRVARSFEHTLVTMLLAGLRHSESEDFSRPGPTAAPYYVKRAEAYIRTHLRDELTVDRIAAVAGVSARSMFYGFKRWRDATPMAYVRNVRLDIARKELEKGRTTGATVSQAAVNAGFSNFSQFSKIYKARFGETPSATLMGA